MNELDAERSADHAIFSAITHLLHNRQKIGGSRATFDKLDGECEWWGRRGGVDQREEEDEAYFGSSIGLESTSSSVSGIVSATVRDFASAAADVAAGSAATAESLPRTQGANMTSSRSASNAKVINNVTSGADLGNNASSALE